MSFKIINEIKLNILNLQALNCRCYVHVLKTIEKHKFNDRFLKKMSIDYKNYNQ